MNALEGGHRAVVITCSTRASAGAYADRSGPLIVDALREWGFHVDPPTVVPDGPRTADTIRDAMTRADLVITTGGTGLSPSDTTPEATRQVIDREVPGIAEALRAAGVAKGVPTAVLSRGIAGVAGRCLVVNLPGSTGGVKDALTVLAPVVDHALDQLRGGDH